MPYAVLGDQVAGQVAAEAAGAAGDQDGVGVVPRGAVALGLGRQGGHPGYQELAVPQSEFGLPRGQRGGQRALGPGAAVQVGQDEAAGVLGLGRADQAPDHRLGRVDRVTVPGHHRVPGEHHEPGALGALVGQPVLHGGQRVGRHQPDHVRKFTLGRGHDRAVDEALGDGLARDRKRLPTDPVQRFAPARPSGLQLLGGDLAQHQRLDLRDRQTGRVGDGQRQAVRPGRGDPDPDGGGADRVQRDPGPGERHPGAVRDRTGQVGGVQGGVQQRGVQAEGVGPDLLVERDLGEHLAVELPGGPDGPEDRPVAVALTGHLLVETAHVELLRALRRPDGERGRIEGRGAGAEHGLGVPVPRAVPGTGVELDSAPPGAVGDADHHLERDVALGRDHQRRGQGEFLDQVAADLVACGQRQFDEGGAGQQDHARDDVVTQPRLGPQREAAGEHHGVRTGQTDRRAQQRVLDDGLAETGGIGGGGRRGQPVTLALEGVGRQRHPARRETGVRGVAVQGAAPGVHPGDGGDELPDLVPPGAQGRDEDRVGGLLGHAVLAHRGQHRVGAELQEAPDTVAGQALHGVPEAHRLPYVPHPVVRRGQLLGGGQAAGDGGDDRDARGGVVEDPGDQAELLEHRLHQGRVKGVRDPQPLGPLEPGGDRQDRVLLTGDHHRARAVHRRDADAGGEQRQDLVLARLDGHQRAAGGQFLHQPAPGGHQGGGVLQREHPGHVGCGDLTDRVPGQEVRAQPPGLHQAVERDLDREQRDLGVAGLVQQLGLG
ncbi:hypothetical protein KCMC57_up16670 [Kitasatospora sp. CMC57]